MNILEISSLFLRGYCYGYLVTSDFQNGTKMKEAYAVLLSWMASWGCCWRLGYPAYSSFQSYWVLSDTLQQSIFDFIRRIFCCVRKNNHWQRDMLTIPCPEEVVISAELSSGLGRRLPCANVRSWSRKKTELTCPKSLTNTLRKAPRRTKKCSGQSVACEENQGEKKKLTLEELKKLSPPGYKEFEAAVGSRDLDEETALQLWEDIFKSLDIFEISKIAYINPTVITQPT